MRARTARLFTTVCERYPSAVISGRAKADVARRLSGAKVRYLIGNHGLEPGTRLGTFERQVVQAHPALETRARGRARHRHREQALLARRALPAGPREAEGARGDPASRRRPAGADAHHPRQARDQRRAGSARRTRATRWSRCAIAPRPTSRCTSATTSPTRTCSGSTSPAACSPIRVGRSRTSAARYYLRQQREIDTLLEHLVALRVDPPAAATPRARGAIVSGRTDTPHPRPRLARVPAVPVADQPRPRAPLAADGEGDRRHRAAASGAALPRPLSRRHRRPAGAGAARRSRNAVGERAAPRRRAAWSNAAAIRPTRAASRSA